MTLLECHDRLVKRLESLGQGFSADFNLKLERIEHLLSLLGNPQKDYRVIHVAGTSGKGSVSTLSAHLLQGRGYKTGLFVSPYLQVVTESCQIDGQFISITFMEALLEECWLAIEQVGEEGEFGLPSYSEVLLALSLLAFSRKGVEVAVVEAFLGGKLDATNIINSEVQVLVSVGLDHVEILGTTVEAIADDKVRIIKPGGYAVCGFTQPSAVKVAEEYAEEIGANIVCIDHDFSYEFTDGRGIMIKTPRRAYQVGARLPDGQFNGHNLACAVAACERFTDLNVQVITKAIGALSMPGRSEVLSNDPLVIIDGAHNPPKVQAALDAIQGLIANKKLVIVYGCKQAFKKGGDVQRFLDERQSEIYDLIAGCQPLEVVFTQFKPKGIWYPEEASGLASDFSEHASRIAVKAIPQATEAFHYSQKRAGEDGAVIVLGSFHVVAEIRDLFIDKEVLLIES